MKIFSFKNNLMNSSNDRIQKFATFHIENLQKMSHINLRSVQMGHGR